jgi:hypothetical protein
MKMEWEVIERGKLDKPLCVLTYRFHTLENKNNERTVIVTKKSERNKKKLRKHLEDTFSFEHLLYNSKPYLKILYIFEYRNTYWFGTKNKVYN